MAMRRREGDRARSPKLAGVRELCGDGSRRRECVQDRGERIRCALTGATVTTDGVRDDRARELSANGSAALSTWRGGIGCGVLIRGSARNGALASYGYPYPSLFSS